MKAIDTAIILAGGNSSRMGFDKRFIRFGNKFLIEIIIDILREIFANIIIVSNDKAIKSDSEIIIVEDKLKDMGPLGGIHAGLLNSNSNYSYFIACDMPYINKKYIHFMINKLNNTNHYGLVTKYKEYLEPFNSFYSKDFIKEIEKHIKSDKRSIYSLLKKSDIIYIEEKTARKFSPDWKMFYNINTIKDLNNLK